MFGWLESPSPEARIDDCVLITGWAFSTGPRIISVCASSATSRWPVAYGLRRRDVASAYPDTAAAAESGFAAFIMFGRDAARGVVLDIRAELEDGRSVRLFAVPLSLPARTIARFRVALSAALTTPSRIASPGAWRSAWSLVMGAPIRAPRRLVGTAAEPVTGSDPSRRTALTGFLDSGARLTIASAAPPVVTAVVVAWNRAELTFACLRALAAQGDVGPEIVVVDNGSTDETPALLTQVDGITVVTNEENLGFTAAANLGAGRAHGEFLLFVNSDAEPLPGAVAQLIETARRGPAIGAVGGKLVFPDGRLQEAGSIVWSDGSCDGYGRCCDPAAGEFNFERDVDFCSAALLLTRRELFDRLGGFDERYRPAYYEDVDYCVRLWSNGWRVAYEPRAVAIHHEFGSAASRDASVRLQRERRPVFAARHAEWLASQRSHEKDWLAVRSHPHGQPAAVIVDDAPPDHRMGAGFPRAAALAAALQDLGFLVTVYATAGRAAGRLEGRLRSVEVVFGSAADLGPFLSTRRECAVVVISRPHNMQYVRASIAKGPAGIGAPCVYDAEAVFALRELGRREVAGRPASDAERRAAIEAETALAAGCGAVLVVSESDGRLFEAAHARTFVASHAVNAPVTLTPFEERHAILFVGAFGGDSPNDDAAAYLAGEILPVLRRRGCDAELVVAGARAPKALESVASRVSVHADVEDLTPLYEGARVFVAPTRFGAGIPLKVLDAAARGVPVVATPLVARQLEWNDGSELLVAETPVEFASAVARLCADRALWTRTRDVARARVERDHNPKRFSAAIADALRCAGVNVRTRKSG